MQFLTWLETSGFGTWVRESPSVWAYPLFITLHTIGLGFVAGVNAAIDLRILGFVPRLPLAPMERFFPVMWFGFWINALSGVALLIPIAVTMLTNPVFYIKLAFIALAVVNLRLLRTRLFDNPASLDTLDTSALPMDGKILAGTSLAFWAGAIIAGRMTAYPGFVITSTIALLIVMAVMLFAGYLARYLYLHLGWGKPLGRQV